MWQFFNSQNKINMNIWVHNLNQSITQICMLKQRSQTPFLAWIIFAQHTKNLFHVHTEFLMIISSIWNSTAIFSKWFELNAQLLAICSKVVEHFPFMYFRSFVLSLFLQELNNFNNFVYASKDEYNSECNIITTFEKLNQF